MTFKKGDVVRCVDNSGYSQLTLGALYRITGAEGRFVGIRPVDPQPCYTTTLDGRIGWRSSRFILDPVSIMSTERTE